MAQRGKRDAICHLARPQGPWCEDRQRRLQRLVRVEPSLRLLHLHCRDPRNGHLGESDPTSGIPPLNVNAPAASVTGAARGTYAPDFCITKAILNQRP
jgi:hypothetical protein